MEQFILGKIDQITGDIHLHRETCRVFDCFQNNTLKPSQQIQSGSAKCSRGMLRIHKLKKLKHLFYDSDLLIKFRILVCFVFKHFPWLWLLLQPKENTKNTKKYINANLSLDNKLRVLLQSYQENETVITSFDTFSASSFFFASSFCFRFFSCS